MAKGRKAKIKTEEMAKTAKPIEKPIEAKPEPIKQPEMRTAVIQPNGDVLRVRIVNACMRRYRIPDCVGDIVTYPKALIQKAIDNGDAEIVK